MSVFERIRIRDLLWWWLGAIVVGVVLYDVHTAPVGLAFLLEGTLAGWLLWLVRRRGLDIGRLLGPAPAPRAVVGAVVAGTLLPILSLAAFVAVYGGLSFLAPEYVRAVLSAIPRQARMFDLDRSFPLLRGILVTVVILVVAPPLEEMTFRGVMLHRWAHRWGVLPALLLSSAAFAALHANKPGAFLLGGALCAVYLRTGSLWLCIAIHAVNNGVAALVGGLPHVPRPVTGSPDIGQLQRATPTAALTLLVLLVPLALYVRAALREGVPLPYARRESAGVMPSGEDAL